MLDKDHCPERAGVLSSARHYPKVVEDAGDGRACTVTGPLSMSGIEPSNKDGDRIFKRVGRKNVRGTC